MALLSYLRHNLVFWGCPPTFFLLRKGLCRVLSENSSHRLIYSDIWSSFGGTVWAGLGGEASLEEVCHWGGLWGFEAVSLLSAYCHSPLHDSHGLWSSRARNPQLNAFFYIVALVTGFCYSNRTFTSRKFWPQIHDSLSLSSVSKVLESKDYQHLLAILLFFCLQQTNGAHTTLL